MILSQVITFWSSANKSGKTLAAIFTALELSSKNKKVLLVDLDFRNPSVSYYFGNDNVKCSIDNIIMSIADGIYTDELLKNNIQSLGNIDYIRGTNSPNEMVKTNDDAKFIESLINTLCCKYEYIVIDVSNTVDNGATYFALKHSDVVFNLVEKDIVFINVFKSIKEHLFDEFDMKKFVNIISKDPKKIQLSDKDLESILGIEITKKFPLLDVNLLNAINSGSLLFYATHDSMYINHYKPVLKRLLNAYVDNELYSNLKPELGAESGITKLGRILISKIKVALKVVKIVTCNKYFIYIIVIGLLSYLVIKMGGPINKFLESTLGFSFEYRH